MNETNEYILRVRDLSKSYAGVKALDRIQLDLRKGEVHALMGENGAGKSTFMKILAGLAAPDSGSIELHGKAFRAENVREVLKAGISMIHQELLMVPELTIAENLFLGKEKTRFFKRWIDKQALREQASALLAQVGLPLSPDTKMKHLSVAEMQMVEIAKAISNEAQIIIMDEPTSAISDKEVATLFGIIGKLRDNGVSIIYISHKMDEIFRIADTITVMRDGQFITTRPAASLDKTTLIRLMVGRELENLFRDNTAEKGAVMLRTARLGRKNVFRDISFQLHAGEILGIAGLMGAGRTEVARAICGLDKPDEGEIFLSGQKVSFRSPSDAIRKGVGYVSEDRKKVGLIPGLSVLQNMTLSSLRSHAPYHLISRSRELAAVSQMTRRLKIKTNGPYQQVSTLSGGNQQKVAIAKVLLAAPRIIILDEPTRGIDIGAKFEIYNLVRQLAAEGLGIILISSELPEIIGLSDRVLVMCQGRQTALLTRNQLSQERIMQHALHH